MKNSLLQMHTNLGTVVSEDDVPYIRYQIILVGIDSVTIRQMDSKQDFQIPKENFLIRYRYCYHSKYIVDQE